MSGFFAPTPIVLVVAAVVVVPFMSGAAELRRQAGAGIGSAWNVVAINIPATSGRP